MLITRSGELQDVRVLVTGGSSGLGRAMAQALAHAGAHVAVSSRDERRAHATAAELGSGALGVGLDVRDGGAGGFWVGSRFWGVGGPRCPVDKAGLRDDAIQPPVHKDYPPVLG